MSCSNSLLFSLNNEGKVYALSTSGSCWREFMYLGLEFKTLSAIPHFLWAVGGDRQIYLHVHGLEIPIRVKEEAYENERWLPLEGFSNRLLPTDRFQYSSQDGTKDRAISRIRLPSMAWQWEGNWQLELTLDGQPLDHDGWTYAVDFPAQFGPTKQWKSCVRRRKWIRYRKFSAMNCWCAIAPLHKDTTQEPFIDVSIGGTLMPYAPPGSMSVWAITAQGRVMYRAGVSATSPEGLKWVNVSIPPNCDVKQISVGPTGLVWATLWSGRVIIRKGITKDCLSGEAWLDVKSPEDTKLTQVAVGHNAVWAVSSDSNVWFRKGIDGNLSGSVEIAALGTGWLNISGNMVQISIGSNDQVFAIGQADKCIYWRSGITPSELSGKRWRLVQANMQLSRTSSTTSVLSSTSNAKHSSLGGLPEELPELKTGIKLHQPWEESHSAPVEQTLPLKPPKQVPSIETAQEHVDLTGKSYETTLKNPRAWSPVRSVGSMVGMEMHPDSDSSVFDVDSGMYYDEEVSQAAWGMCDTTWSCVEAGACNIDILQTPHWFADIQNTGNSDLHAEWRNTILNDLKYLNSTKEFDLSLYSVAIEEKGWTRSCEARLINKNSSTEDCLISLYWHSLESMGTLSLIHPDGEIKFILNVCEISCVMPSSEPGCPRLTLVIPSQHETFIKIQFMTEMEQEEWLNVLLDIISQIHGIQGKPSSNSVWAVTQLGDVINWDASLAIHSNAEGFFEKEFQVSGKDVANGFSTLLYNGFPPESYLQITGCMFDEIKRFRVDLRGPEITKHRHKLEKEILSIPFHFNVRFDETKIICNSKIFGDWNEEQRHDLPLSQGQEFSLKILCTEQGFKIVLNGMNFCFFEHRLPLESITSVYIQGDLRLYRMVYCTSNLIVSPETMVWRVIGGHLRRVECCKNDVVWGLTHDHRAYVFTGGWGGGILKGLGNKEGIHAMTDTQTYCVYENQRWNPIYGYTSTGLPTDRFMWSDVTGKYKRTREHTKLLNRHWHWISDWLIDYNTPGGVDAEGWQYATDFPGPYHAKKVFTDCVRRRRWYRKAQLATEGPWLRVGNIQLVDISLWAIGDTISVWAVTVNGDAIFRTAVTTSTPTGITWEHINSPQPLTSISVYEDVVWAVGRKGELYYRAGITDDVPIGSTWKLVEAPKSSFNYKTSGGVKSVTLSKNSAWVVLCNDSLAVRTEVCSALPDGKLWKYFSENEVPLKQMSAGETAMWGAGRDGSLLRRAGGEAGWLPVLPTGLAHVAARGKPF